MKTIVAALIAEIHDLAAKVQKVNGLLPKSNASTTLDTLYRDLKYAEIVLTEDVKGVPNA